MDDSSFHSLKEKYNTSKWNPLKEMLIEKPWYYLDNVTIEQLLTIIMVVLTVTQVQKSVGWRVHTGVWEYSKMLEV